MENRILRYRQSPDKSPFGAPNISSTRTIVFDMIVLMGPIFYELAINSIVTTKGGWQNPIHKVVGAIGDPSAINDRVYMCLPWIRVSAKYHRYEFGMYQKLFRAPQSPARVLELNFKHTRDKVPR